MSEANKRGDEIPFGEAQDFGGLLFSLPEDKKDELRKAWMNEFANMFTVSTDEEGNTRAAHRVTWGMLDDVRAAADGLEIQDTGWEYVE